MELKPYTERHCDYIRDDMKNKITKVQVSTHELYSCAIEYLLLSQFGSNIVGKDIERYHLYFLPNHKAKYFLSISLSYLSSKLICTIKS